MGFLYYLSFPFIMLALSGSSSIPSGSSVQGDLAKQIIRQDIQYNPDELIGTHFLDVREASPSGEYHRLSEYVGKGQWVLIDFWASWCGPCKREMPNVVEAYKKYHNKGFEIIGLSFDVSRDDWIEAIRAWGMPWIHLSDLNGWETEAGRIYGIRAIPDNLLINPDGIIVARDLRGPELEERLSVIFD